MAEYAPTTAYEWVGFLANYGAELARLELRGLRASRAATAFARVLDLTSGIGRPAPLLRDGDVLRVEVPACPPKHRLRISWVLAE